MGQRLKHVLDLSLLIFFHRRDLVFPWLPLLGTCVLAGAARTWLTVGAALLGTLGTAAWFGIRLSRFRRITYLSRYDMIVICNATWAPDKHRFDEWASTLIYLWHTSKPKELWTREALKKTLDGVWVYFTDRDLILETSPSHKKESLISRWNMGRDYRGVIEVGTCDTWDNPKAAWQHVRHLFFHQASHTLLFRLNRKYKKETSAHVRMSRANIPTRSQP